MRPLVYSEWLKWRALEGHYAKVLQDVDVGLEAPGGSKIGAGGSRIGAELTDVQWSGG